MAYSGFDLSGGGYQSGVNTAALQNDQNNPNGGRWINGQFVTPSPGQIWGPNNSIVNAGQLNAANMATEQANKDLAGVGSISEINTAGAAAADPFASQRGQYQNALSNLMNGNFSVNDPSYQFRLGQGQQALERSQAAKGMLGSGNILQALQDYGQGMASTEYQNQYNRLLPLTGATTGSPAAAGTIKSGLLDSRNNALANLGASMQIQGGQPTFGGGSSFGSSFAPTAGGASGAGGGGAGGLGGIGGGSSAGGLSGGAGMSGGSGGTGHSLGYDPAYSDEMLRRQMAAGGGTYSGDNSGGGGFINAVPETGNPWGNSAPGGAAAGKPGRALTPIDLWELSMGMEVGR